ncbi:f-box domain protein [Rutstroemia sp. NJR-2017a BBW]|nr:f-box domain protein [Rutstroemia sp. NJR-2017a BBW]
MRLPSDEDTIIPKLPMEIIDLIIHSIGNTTREEIQDLEALRLTSKNFSEVAAKELFSNCSINLQDLRSEESDTTDFSDDRLDDSDDLNGSEDGNEDEDEKERADDPLLQTKLAKVCGVKNLANSVRTIRYITNLDPNTPFCDYSNREKPNTLEPVMRRAIHLCKNFPNLTRIEVEFACVCTFQETHWLSFSMKAEDTYKYRQAILKSLFGALSSSENLTPYLTTLSLKNLQNVNKPALVTSEKFTKLLKRITNLRLRIVMEEVEHAPESSWYLEEMHTFFHKLPFAWLKPCSENLTSLTLHAVEWWGYYPKCDFRGLHFPKLKFLELGNYTFTHRWQMEWIYSHGDTLETLVLDDAVIVQRFRLSGSVDSEGYPVEPWQQDGDDITQHNFTRWADYLAEIPVKLPKLRVFKMGAGVWDNGENFDGMEMSRFGVHAANYMSLDCGMGPAPWLKTDEDIKICRNEEDERVLKGDKRLLFEKAYLEKDVTAYDKLMRILEERKQNTAY